MTENKYAIFDNMIEGIQIVDADWKYVYINKTAATQGNSTREALIGHTMMSKYPGIEQTEMFGLLRKCLKDRQFREMINEFDFPDGSKGFFELRMQAVPEGILILSFDITAMKRAEQMLKELNVQLEAKVKARTYALEAKNSELKQFAYVASHDLQEPLKTVISYSELLANNYMGQLDERADKSLRFILESSHRMKNLIHSLLEYYLIGRKKKKKKTDINKIVREVLSDMHGLIEEKSAKISHQKLPALSVYPTELRQLIQNLISNAIKFQKVNTIPEIEITAKKAKDTWVFCVKDNGIGIDKAYQEKIFLIFQRLHPHSKYEGTGIGLAHAKKIVELHDGKIWIDSKPGEGSSIFFTIPD